jgi:Domain of unknown function (DUF4189)
MLLNQRLFVIFLVVVAMVLAVPAYSQHNCGSGYIQEGGGNAGYTSCIAMEAPPSSVSLEDPGPLWSMRWGAIAVDGVAGKFGGIDGLDSKRRAEMAATKQCRTFGGKKCKVVISYRNQCGVMAWGDSFYASSTGPDINETAQRAVNICGTNTENCKPDYAGCSYPQQIR